MNNKSCVEAWLDANGRSFDFTDEDNDCSEFVWTWYNDEGENCGTSILESMSYDIDCNGEEIIMVSFDDRSCTLDSLDYENVFGDNFVDYLYNEYLYYME